MNKEEIARRIAAGEKLDLAWIDLSGLDLHGADLRAVDLQGTDFTGRNLRGAYLSRSNLKFAKLTSCDLRKADLWRTDLTGAKLDQADCRGVDFSQIGDDIGLIRVSFQQANLCGSNLSVYMHFCDVSSATFDDRTVWPNAESKRVMIERGAREVERETVFSRLFPSLSFWKLKCPKCKSTRYRTVRDYLVCTKCGKSFTK